jgi:60S ribosome subunit biogenesis protein NIP7|tara:strand:- start:236 stop:727 length:492 start_codon:yes stop_codon:yes gene_type:complete
MKLKDLNSKDLEILKGITEYGVELSLILKDNILMASDHNRKEIFILKKETREVLCKIKHQPYFAGLFIGEIKREKFYLSLEGGSLITPYSNKLIKINDKAEQLVLYGRDVFINSILKYKKNSLIKGSKYLIVNKKNEFLAIGKFDGKIIKNLHDKGWYLRKGQ